MNPLLDFSGLPRFDAIAPEHVAPAIQSLLAENRARFVAKPEDAEKLLEVGEAPSSANIDAAELASWTLLANAVLSSDATIVKD